MAVHQDNLILNGPSNSALLAAYEDALTEVEEAKFVAGQKLRFKRKE